MEMMTSYPTTALEEALQRLGDTGLLPVAAKHLDKNASAINAALGKTVLAEIPAYSESRNPDILPELAGHASRHTAEMVRLLRGGAAGDFEFVRVHAKRRAEQRFPLEATLHAYRCGHKVFSHRIREAMLAAASSAEDARKIVAAVADFTIEYTDVVSTIAASAYVAQTRLLADVAGDHRAELLNILLGGYDESDGRVAEILRNAGYLGGHQSFCIVLAQPVDPAEMQNPARARRLADAINTLFHGTSPRRLVDVRDNKVTAVFSDARRASGWTVPHTTLARRLAAELSMLSNSVLIGVSNDVPSTSQIPNAYREALLALELADVTHRVVQFSEIPVRQLLMHLAGEEFQHALPAWAGNFLRADDKAGGMLVATLRAYADADMNVLKAAGILSVHPNTIYARMQKVLDITEMDARSFHALSELLIVAECRTQSSGGDSA